MSELKIRYQCKGYRPLYVSEEYILAFKNGSFYKCSFDLKQFEYIVSLPIKFFFQRLGNYSRLLERIFRSQPTHAQKINEHEYLIFSGSYIWVIDVFTKMIRFDFLIPQNRKALNCTYIEVEDFEPGYVFGEYFENLERDAVSLWARSNSDGAWHSVYTFDKNEINHVHNVVPDPIRKCVWILTGDFEDAACIWMAKSNFKDVQPILRGSQLYRAVWLSYFNDRIVYATDTQFEANGVYELINKDGLWSTSFVGDINGSSIYSTDQGCIKYFSTALEPGGMSGRFIKDLMTREFGAGIQSKHAKIYSIDKEFQVKDVFSAEKDWMPHRLGQFGSFIFPAGVMPDGMVIVYGIAVKKFDDSCLVLQCVEE